MKTTLLVDGNWLLMSRAFVLSKYFLKDNPQEMKEDGKQQLVDLMARSISICLNRFHNSIQNIVVVSDGGSWRKQLDRPKSMGDITYKGNRQAQVEYDWDYIFDALNQLTINTKQAGITTSHHLNIEGDDWAWYWSRRLNDEGDNLLIWSSDNDLKQLIQSKGLAFTAWYNDKTGLFLPESLKEKPVDEVEFFLTSGITNPYLETLKREAGEVTYINPDDIVMEKIICGDSGDNIKSLMRIEKGGRTYGIGCKDWDKIKNNLNISNINEFLNQKDKVISNLLNIKKFQGYTINKEEIDEVFNYNKTLVWLNESILPETALQSMNNEEYKDFDTKELLNNYKLIVGEDTTDIEKLFNDLPF